MGLIKTAMMSGVAIYGVKELSKAAQSRNNNNNTNYGPPPRRDANYDDRRAYDQGGDYSRRETRYDDNPSQYSRNAPNSDSYGGADTKQRALAGTNDLGSNADYFNPHRREERSSYEYGRNRQHTNTPPPYNEYAEQRQQRGYVEGEVYDDQSQRSGNHNGGGFEDVMNMVSSGILGGDKRGGRGGDGQFGSLISGLSKR